MQNHKAFKQLQGLRGYSRSLTLSPFNGPRVISYSCSTVTMCLSRIASEILNASQVRERGLLGFSTHKHRLRLRMMESTQAHKMLNFPPFIHQPNSSITYLHNALQHISPYMTAYISTLDSSKTNSSLSDLKKQLAGIHNFSLNLTPCTQSRLYFTLIPLFLITKFIFQTVLFII